MFEIEFKKSVFKDFKKIQKKISNKILKSIEALRDNPFLYPAQERCLQKSPMKFAVLASTRGTDLQAIIDEMKAGRLTAELACVVSDKKDCQALARAQSQGFKTHWIDPKEKSRVDAPKGANRALGEPVGSSGEEFDRELVHILKSEKVDLVVLVGYLRILTPYIVGEFRGRIINVHPSLLPKFGGKNFYGKSVYEAVLKAGEKETGMTIHFVEEEVDAGHIILQKKCPVLPDDTPKTLQERVQALEKEWYPKVIQAFSEGRMLS